LIMVALAAAAAAAEARPFLVSPSPSDVVSEDVTPLLLPLPLLNEVERLGEPPSLYSGTILVEVELPARTHAGLVLPPRSLASARCASGTETPPSPPLVLCPAVLLLPTFRDSASHACDAALAAAGPLLSLCGAAFRSDFKPPALPPPPSLPLRSVVKRPTLFSGLGDRETCFLVGMGRYGGCAAAAAAAVFFVRSDSTTIVFCALGTSLSDFLRLEEVTDNGSGGLLGSGGACGGGDGGCGRGTPKYALAGLASGTRRVPSGCCCCCCCHHRCC
jgi:hypothetical protein